MEIRGGKHGEDVEQEAGRVGVAQGGPASSPAQLQRAQRMAQHAGRRHQAAPTPYRQRSPPSSSAAASWRCCGRTQQGRLLLLLLRHGLPLVAMGRTRLL